MILMFNWVLHKPLMKIITESPFKTLLFRKISGPEVYLQKTLSNIRRFYWRNSSPFSAWCQLKGQTYLNKPVAFRCRFVYVFVTFQWTPGVKGMAAFSRVSITLLKFLLSFPPKITSSK